ncbi:hypothetical protein LTR28_001070, partial [Elasticomyces elasticus]
MASRSARVTPKLVKDDDEHSTAGAGHGGFETRPVARGVLAGGLTEDGGTRMRSETSRVCANFVGRGGGGIAIPGRVERASGSGGGGGSIA